MGACASEWGHVSVNGGVSQLMGMWEAQNEWGGLVMEERGRARNAVARARSLGVPGMPNAFSLGLAAAV